MRPFSFIGIFCEDIREEVGGTHSIVGVLPDNVAIGRLPGMMPKLGVYIRIQIDSDADPKSLKARMKTPDGATFELADFGELIRGTKEHAEVAKFPISLIAKGALTPLPINKVGRIEAIVEVDGTEYVCGVLNLIQQDASVKTPSASATPP